MEEVLMSWELSELERKKDVNYPGLDLDSADVWDVQFGLRLKSYNTKYLLSLRSEKCPHSAIHFIKYLQLSPSIVTHNWGKKVPTNTLKSLIICKILCKITRKSVVCEFPIQRPADVIIPVSVLATSSFKHGKSKTLQRLRREKQFMKWL